MVIPQYNDNILTSTVSTPDALKKKRDFRALAYHVSSIKTKLYQAKQNTKEI